MRKMVTVIYGSLFRGRYFNSYDKLETKRGEISHCFLYIFSCLIIIYLFSPCKNTFCPKYLPMDYFDLSSTKIMGVRVMRGYPGIGGKPGSDDTYFF